MRPYYAIAQLLFYEGLVFVEVDILVEFGGAVFAFWEEVETDTTDVLLGTEILEIVDLVALDLEFHRAP